MKAVDDRQEKLARAHAVDHAVIERAREPADVPHDHLTVGPGTSAQLRRPRYAATASAWSTIGAG